MEGGTFTVSTDVLPQDTKTSWFHYRFFTALRFIPSSAIFALLSLQHNFLSLAFITIENLMILFCFSPGIFLVKHRQHSKLSNIFSRSPWFDIWLKDVSCFQCKERWKNCCSRSNLFTRISNRDEEKSLARMEWKGNHGSSKIELRECNKETSRGKQFDAENSS